MKKDQIVELDILEINNLGCGVGKICGGEDDGVVVFVAGALSGERVLAKLIKVNKTYAVGRLERLLTPSPYRAKKLYCDAPAACGGCIYRNISYEHELELKLNYVANAFRKVGLPEVKISDVRSSGELWHYRNKAQYPVARSAKRGIYAGLYAQKSHDVIPVNSCSMQPTLFADICEFVCRRAENYGITVYDEKTGRGLLRHIYLREGRASGQIMLCLVINGESLPHAEKLVADIRAAFVSVSSIMLNINKKNSNVVLGDRFVCLYGNDYIEDSLCGVKFRISAGSFYQVNHDGAELLYTRARELASLKKDDILLDLYCGAGTIGLTMSKYVREVIGIEIVDEAIVCAKQNAALNGITNASFYCGDASNTEKLLASAEQVRGRIDADVVVIDPPRKGTTKELISFIASRGIGRVVYVSCNPDTLARDCKDFADAGYSIGEVVPVDMFPRTGHVESVVLLSR